MPSMQDTTLTIKQTLDIESGINFINWELNVQDVASTARRTITGAQGLLGLVLNAAQWNIFAAWVLKLRTLSSFSAWISSSLLTVRVVVFP